MLVLFHSSPSLDARFFRQMQEYSFRLHENDKFGWSPRLSSKDFLALLANVTALKIRGAYVPMGMGFLDEVRKQQWPKGFFFRDGARLAPVTDNF